MYRLYIKEEIKNRETERGNINNLITWALFFLLMGIGHILKIINSINSINGTTPISIEKFLDKVGLICIFSGFLTKIIYLEHEIITMELYKKYIFSIILSFVLLFIIIIDYDVITEAGIIQVIFLALVVIGYSVLPSLYLYLAIKTEGKSRIKALEVSIGALFFGLFSLLQVDNAVGYYGGSQILDIAIELMYITGPAGVILACLLIFDSFRKRD